MALESNFPREVYKTRRSQDNLAEKDDGFDYSKFRSENWKELDYPEKLQLLQQAENYEASISERPPCQIAPDFEHDNGGYYDSKLGMIRISENDIDNNPYKALATLFHEERHCYQNDTVDHPSRHDEPLELVEKWAHDNGEAYIPAPDKKHPETLRYFYPDYYFQSQERDARKFSDDKMNSLEAIFGDAPEYQQYKSDRDFNNMQALEMSKIADGFTTEDEAAEIADKRVEQRYAALSQGKPDPYKGVNEREKPFESENKDAENAVSDGYYDKNNSDMASDYFLTGYELNNNLSDGTNYVDDEIGYHQERGMTRGGNGTVTKPAPGDTEYADRYYADSEDNGQNVNNIYGQSSDFSQPDTDSLEKDEPQNIESESEARPNDDVKTLDFENGEKQNSAQQPTANDESSIPETKTNDDIETLDFENGEGQNSAQQPMANGETTTPETKSNDDIETLDFENGENQNSAQKPTANDESSSPRTKSNDDIETLDFGNGEDRNSAQQPTANGETTSPGIKSNDDIETLDFENGEDQNSAQQPTPTANDESSTPESKSNDKNESKPESESQSDSEQQSPLSGGADDGEDYYNYYGYGM